MLHMRNDKIGHNRARVISLYYTSIVCLETSQKTNFWFGREYSVTTYADNHWPLHKNKYIKHF